MRQSVPGLVALTLALGGCSEPESGVPKEVVAERTLAARHACMAGELDRQAADDLATLEQTLAAAGGTGQAATTFARAFAQHAQLRATAYAQTDSALNHSEAPGDSTRHANAARSMEILRPPAESVEANVVASYEQKLAAGLADTDHPCNWKHELESAAGR